MNMHANLCMYAIFRLFFFNDQMPEQYVYAWIFNGDDIKVEVANFCAVMDTLVVQDGACELLCSDGHLGRSRCGSLNILCLNLL